MDLRGAESGTALMGHRIGSDSLEIRVEKTYNVSLKAGDSTSRC